MTGRDSYDAIVVGAGIGGLTCAAFLARQGLRVLVAEQSAAAGGCCSAFRADGFTFDAAVHHVSGGGPRSLVGEALSRVGARLALARLDPMDTLIWPDARFEVPGDWERLISSLVRAFPSEASGVAALFAELLRLYREVLGSSGRRTLIERWGNSTFLDFLTHFVNDELLIRILSGQWGYLGAPPDRLATVGMCQMLVNYWRDGAFYPYGGTQAIASALVNAISSSGGTVRTSSAVKQIKVKGNRASGVVLGDGTSINARYVVSNADVPQTVTRLLRDDITRDYQMTISALEVSSPFFLMYLGVAPGFDTRRLPRGFYHVDCKLGGRWLYVSSASEVDPSLAPPGKHGFTVVVSLHGSETRIDSWQDAKDVKSEETLAFLDAFAPGFGRHVELVRTAHPPHPDRRTSNFCGAPYGWAVIPGQSGPTRLSQQTPIENVYFAGHWTVPGPGVCAVIASGWRAANHIVRSARAG